MRLLSKLFGRLPKNEPLALPADTRGRVDMAIRTLREAADEDGLEAYQRSALEHILLTGRTRGEVEEALYRQTIMNPLALQSLESFELERFKIQYEALPKRNMLNRPRSQWGDVVFRMNDPRNREKMKKVIEGLQGGGRLYAILEDGSLEFMDDHSQYPPRFLKDTETGALQIIFYDEERRDLINTEIDKNTHEWASIKEILAWVKSNEFNLFQSDSKDRKKFGKLMKLAQAASPNKLFVGKRDFNAQSVLLGENNMAYQDERKNHVRVLYKNPTYRDPILGCLRRLNV